MSINLMSYSILVETVCINTPCMKKNTCLYLSMSMDDLHIQFNEGDPSVIIWWNIRAPIFHNRHYSDAIAMATQITSFTILYSTVYSGADDRKHQRSASLAFEWGIHQWPVNSPHKWPVTRKMFPFDDVITVKSIYSLGTRSISL